MSRTPPLRRGLRQGRGAWRPSPVRRLATTQTNPQKYHGQDYNPDDIKSERVMPWIVPDHQTITNRSEQGV